MKLELRNFLLQYSLLSFHHYDAQGKNICILKKFNSVNCSHFNISSYELSFLLTHKQQPSMTGFLEQRKCDKEGRASITPEGKECEKVLTIKKQVTSKIV